MRQHPSQHRLSLVAYPLLLGLAAASCCAAAAESPPRTETPLAIPTFHCLGLYWSPPGGAADRAVAIRFRRQGTSDWNEALPMRYNPIPDTDEDLADYRGSIVHLAPATTYEIDRSHSDRGRP